MRTLSCRMRRGRGSGNGSQSLERSSSRCETAERKLQGSVSEIYSLPLRSIRSIINEPKRPVSSGDSDNPRNRPAQGRILGGEGSKTETKIADT
jgi:hypothetical protein